MMVSVREMMMDGEGGGGRWEEEKKKEKCEHLRVHLPRGVGWSGCIIFRAIGDPGF